MKYREINQRANSSISPTTELGVQLRPPAAGTTLLTKILRVCQAGMKCHFLEEGQGHGFCEVAEGEHDIVEDPTFGKWVVL